MNTVEQLTVGEYVANDFRTAALFSKYGIDFCCKGNRTLEEVCIKKNINPADLENEINSVLESKNDNAIDFKSWSPTLLIDYIIEKHHSYVEEKSVVLLQFLDKLCKVHGERHP
ncbi:MAG: iron-sulfur cluster repair di-iron protein, partial [Bacteroidetes bacterium HGW-Bacteroidetes-23]